MTFRQNYDFPFLPEDIVEYGEILLITNTTTSPITLGYVEDYSSGWEEAQFDLTPHMNKLVYVVWHYVILSFQNYPRLGWLIDDISLTVEGPITTVVVTNNLAQSTWTLSGPLIEIGQGHFVSCERAAESK